MHTYVLKVEAETAYLGAKRDGTEIGSDYEVREPWRSLYSSRFETLLVEVVADDGTSGWGEALAPVGPEVPAAVVNRLLAPVLIGRSAAEPRPTWFVLRDLMRERGHLVGHQADALAAVDIALWDLAGRVRRASVAALLGGAFRQQVPTYVSGLPRTSDDERAELAAEWAADGARAVKLHLGYGVHEDLATVDAIRRRAPALHIAVDAHWAYTVTEAAALARGLAQRGGWFLEAPLAPEDLDGHRELTARAQIPIAVGEAMRNRFEVALWLGQRALRIAQPDVARTGITELMSIGEVASAHHVPLAPHHSVGLGVSLAAGIQVSAALENLFAFEYQPTSVQVGQRLLREPLSIEPASMRLPPGDGLGIDVDRDTLIALAEED